MESTKNGKTGVLLVGHGTRDAAGVEQFHQLVEQVTRALPQCVCAGCFLEIVEPDIAAGVRQLVAAGVERMVVMPLLLFAAGHAKQDVPLAVQAALREHPQVAWVQAAHLGLNDQLLRQSQARAREALGDTVSGGAAVSLVVVGRGSFDPDAIAETQAYAAELSQRLDSPNYRTAFYAMAQPKLAEVLTEVADSPQGCVLVVPHLLFDGLIMQSIVDIADDFQRRFPLTRWVLAKPLGPTSLVAAAVIERIASAQAQMGKMAAVVGN